jgi:hypothetical protein
VTVWRSKHVGALQARSSLSPLCLFRSVSRFRPPPTRERPLNRVEHLTQVGPDIFRQKAQDKIAVLLEDQVLAPIATICLGIGEMLRSIDLDRYAALRGERLPAARCRRRGSAGPGSSGTSRLSAAGSRRAASSSGKVRRVVGKKRVGAGRPLCRESGGARCPCSSVNRAVIPGGSNS